MSIHFLFLALVTLIVTLDNALLCGALLPSASGRIQSEIATIVGTLLAIAQSLMAIGIGRLLDNQVFCILAIVILAWICIKVLRRKSQMKEVNRLRATVTVFLYTFCGDTGNMIWLGMAHKGDSIALIVLSICSIPLFVVVALFFAKQAEQYDWILFLGAAMMAWIAGSLFVKTTIGRTISATLPPLVVQVLFAALLMAIALKVRTYNKLH
jgi:predicted tellurium resistance membrane protein TerC